jgi:hypothetical protein
VLQAVSQPTFDHVAFADLLHQVLEPHLCVSRKNCDDVGDAHRIWLSVRGQAAGSGACKLPRTAAAAAAAAAAAHA